jgi:nucleoside-diphosphate-sugar epimerase
VSKLAGEYYARTYHDTFGVPTTVLRYFNVFGPGERPGRYRNVIPNFIRRALDGESLTITGTGEETREYVFVDDAVHATLLAAVTDPAQGQVLHVGSGAVLTTRGLAERVLAATGSRAPVTHVARRSWDAVAHRSTSSAKARRMLGYEPRVPFDEGLARTVEWIRRLPTPDR